MIEIAHDFGARFSGPTPARGTTSSDAADRFGIRHGEPRGALRDALGPSRASPTDGLKREVRPRARKVQKRSSKLNPSGAEHPTRERPRQDRAAGFP